MPLVDIKMALGNSIKWKSIQETLDGPMLQTCLMSIIGENFIEAIVYNNWYKT